MAEIEDVEEPSEDELSLLEPSPKAKGPRVPMPPRAPRAQAEAPAPAQAPTPIAPTQAPAASVVSIPSRLSSVSSAPVVVRTAAPAPAAPAVLAPVTVQPPVTMRPPVTTYTYVPTQAPPQPAPVTRLPAAPAPRSGADSLFDALDANGDGVLDANEFAQLATVTGRRAPPMASAGRFPVEPITQVPSRVGSPVAVALREV